MAPRIHVKIINIMAWSIDPTIDELDETEGMYIRSLAIRQVENLWREGFRITPRGKAEILYDIQDEWPCDAAQGTWEI